MVATRKFHLKSFLYAQNKDKKWQLISVSPRRPNTLKSPEHYILRSCLQLILDTHLSIQIVWKINIYNVNHSKYYHSSILICYKPYRNLF
jgi:hypothetical protein